MLPPTEVFPYFPYVLLLLVAVQDEFFSSTYPLRSMVSRNVFNIIDLVGFNHDHPFGNAPFALFALLCLLKKIEYLRGVGVVHQSS